ncbi:hypothetical protein [Azospirillum sp. TSO22-1]|uniref:hypothetical protein n=1 Tax=Azospirillum sp. TSO22-1 TaxID=716789 RepID=UPI000D61CDA3|nr:hypothetical protein [Azospirillum sp. TSO22-1]PWC42343.1 hypothetical protein TSO221_22000 [Azospirillum sp. TSO22-1]
MKPLCGWRMPEDETRAMLAMLDREIAGCSDHPQRRSALRRFQAMLQEDLRAMQAGRRPN